MKIFEEEAVREKVFTVTERKLAFDEDWPRNKRQCNGPCYSRNLDSFT